MKLILVRHGESIWNKENKFTGWTDVPLSEKGINEAIEAGKILKKNGYTFDVAYTSVLKRANDTLNYILDELNLNTKMLVQVHDELVFDVPNNEVEEVIPIIRDVMENIYELKVPLKVDIEYGKTWYEAK